MKVGQLTSKQVAQALAGDGLRIGIGEYSLSLQSPYNQVADAVYKLYADYDVLDTCSFIDFHMEIATNSFFRRFYHPQVNFWYDGFKPFKPLPQDQAFPLFEWSLNWCVATQVLNRLVLHAAVVEKNGKAIILPAPPGSGKSTLCAGLVSRGWRLLSDELAIISYDGKEVTPFPRPINLKNDSIDIMRNYSPSAVFGPVVRDTTKGTVAHLRAPSSSVERAHDKPAPFSVIFPKYVKGSPVVFREETKGKTFMQLVQNAFNYSAIGVVGFEAMTNLVSNVSCYHFEYSDLDDAFSAFNELV